MKLPSLHYLSAQAKSSFMRFPMSIISALLAVILAIYLIEYNKNHDNLFPFINAMLCLSIGIPLYFCAAIVGEKNQLDRVKKIYLNTFVTAILFLIFISLPDVDSTYNTSIPYIRYGLYNVTAHLFVSIVPFIFVLQLNGYWNYNKTLFLRILLSILYSGFIYVGLILALTALKLLFDIDIHEELYFEIWVVVIGLFNTWFFVSGIPADFQKLDETYEYPNGLRVFSQYVLIPLLALYVLILYSYGGKIVMTANWPKGIVVYLITVVSILGILTFLLIHPYGNLREHSWIKKASRGYYFALLPLLVLLFIAIFMRINEYGITVNRFAIVLLAIWISIVSIYTVLGKTNIKFIPISLAIILILSSFGPWSLFNVSEKSQVNRLRHILEQSKIMVNGKIQNETIWEKDSLPKLYSKNEFVNEPKLNDSIHNEVLSIIEYLDDHHGYQSIRSWYQQDLKSIVDLQQSKKSKKNIYLPGESEIYMRSLGLKNELKAKSNETNYLSYQVSNEKNVTDITGYQYYVNFEKYLSSSADNKITNFRLAENDYKMTFESKNNLTLILKGAKDSIRIELKPLIDKLKSKYGRQSNYDLPAEELTIVSSCTSFAIKLHIQSLEFESKKSVDLMKMIKGYVLLKKN